MGEQHKHTNRLKDESSPYLQQHAHNPVDWYAWGEEALERARREDKPILLSIGYSACHWCHVMERESFENEEIARLMNEHFVNIKVDREERPDIDQTYMNAVQMMLGHGGWPLTVFLTPQLIPFYGGTYFPPADRYNLPGFPRVLQGVAEAYRSKPDEVERTASDVLGALRGMGAASESNSPVDAQLLDVAFRGVSRGYDPRHGGFGNAPKFPAAMNLEFLLRTHKRTGDADALRMVEHTCRRMAEGGMYDQLGGGFHRYSVDAKWLVPHFEKMLYDNALLSRLYLHAYQATREEFYRRVAEETLGYVVREMTDAGGGFYSTQDADSEGVEGKFFVWSTEEVEELLGREDARLFNAYYDVTEEGNFEEKNILNVPRTVEEVAKELKVGVEELRAALEHGRRALFEAREKRVKPGRDEKVISGWNGMMLESFALAAAVLDRGDYRRVAESNADFLLSKLRDERGLLLHVYKDGRAKHRAFQDDYACVAAGLLALYETTGDVRRLRESVALTDLMIEEFWDEEAGGFFYVGRSGEQLIVRNKDFFDNATPSGNSVAAGLMLRLAVLTENETYHRRAVTIFRLLRDTVARHPSGFGQLLSALDFYLSAPKEIAVVAPPGSTGGAELLREVWRRHLPNKVVAFSAAADDEAPSFVPLLRDRPAIGGRATAYVCEHYACKQPATRPEELAKQLDE